jgi:glycosyltransferase involved in cell wall biosynthesis
MNKLEPNLQNNKTSPYASIFKNGKVFYFQLILDRQATRCYFSFLMEQEKMKNKLRVLALEAYYGGSHKAFLDGWIRSSAHEWHIENLPAHHWKWRMRHSGIHFAEKFRHLRNGGMTFDIIFTSSMTNLAEFKGLAGRELSETPVVLYFHENQLTYPVPPGGKLDYQAVITNFTSALAADSVWFNSRFNMDSLLENLPVFLKKMPDFKPVGKMESLRKKSKVRYPGIDDMRVSIKKEDKKPFKIIWAARWEYDKNPEGFFQALRIFRESGADFRLSVIGEKFRKYPSVFDSAEQEFKGHIDRWGYLESRECFRNELNNADVAVSTAIHEFFGIGMLEAASAGAFPLMPERLAYPEIFSDEGKEPFREFFYENEPRALALKLKGLYRRFCEKGSVWKGVPVSARKVATRFHWEKKAPELDMTLEAVFNKKNLNCLNQGDI